MACNRNDSRIRQTNAYQEISIWMDHETTKEVVRMLKAGAAISEIIAVMGHAGVITAPPAWVVAVLGIILYGIAEDLQTVDEGCGIKIGTWQSPPSSNPNYVYEAQ